jgi:hypothetical protein
MRTLITSNSEPLAPEVVARMIADFKRRNPHLCDDVEDAGQSMRHDHAPDSPEFD